MDVQTIIQTTAAVIQASAAILFFKTVRDSRRDEIIARLHRVWRRTANAPTPEELEGFPYSKHQIDFFNSKLRESGENWSYPFKRV
jgi:hypothetical protein